MSQSWDRVGSQSPAKTGNEWAGGGGGGKETKELGETQMKDLS